MAELSKDLRIFISHRAGETLVEIGGELDALTADVLDDRLQLAVNESHADVLLDMSGVTFCDSFALRSVVRAQRNLSRSGGHLRIVNPSAPVFRLLDLTGLRHLAGHSPARRRPDLGAFDARAKSNGPVHHDVADADAVADQLVDEVMERLLALDPAVPEAVDLAAVRRAAEQLVERLSGPEGPQTRARILNVLWMADRGGRPPLRWWSTPLGRAVHECPRIDVATGFHPAPER